MVHGSRTHGAPSGVRWREPQAALLMPFSLVLICSAHCSVVPGRLQVIRHEFSRVFLVPCQRLYPLKNDPAKVKLPFNLSAEQASSVAARVPQRLRHAGDHPQLFSVLNC
jgi:hypothetical protein